MNKIKRIHCMGFLSIILFLVLFLWLFAPVAHAAEDIPIDLGVTEITGTLENGQFHLTPKQTEDLFDLDGSLFPGGSWKKTLRVVNDCSRTMSFTIISVTTQEEDTTLFDLLNLKIMQEDDILYEGTYGAGSEEDPLTETYQIRGGKTLEFDIYVSLEETHGNELQGKSMNSLWTYGSDYDYPPSKADYIVLYEDEDGNELHEPKTGRARVGNTVTEKAVEIEGYSPDAQEKSIEIKRNEAKNVIRFIYTKNDVPVVPDEPNPDEPGAEPDPEPEPEKPGPHVPQTGVDLEDNSTLIMVLVICMAACALVAILVVRKIIVIKKKHLTP